MHKLKLMTMGVFKHLTHKVLDLSVKGMFQQVALDVIWDKKLNPYIMEINRWPGLDQSHSKVFKATVFTRVFPEAVQIVMDAHPEVFGEIGRAHV